MQPHTGTQRYEFANIAFGIPVEQRSHPLESLHALSGADDPTILRMAIQIARSFPESSLQRIFSATADCYQNGQSLLAALAYHYALGFYSSQEISERLQNGKPMLWPSPDQPGANLIRRFRNRNHITVERALERCLFQFAEATSLAASNTPYFARIIRAEARFRVHQAELADLEHQF